MKIHRFINLVPLNYVMFTSIPPLDVSPVIRNLVHRGLPIRSTSCTIWWSSGGSSLIWRKPYWCMTRLGEWYSTMSKKIMAVRARHSSSLPLYAEYGCHIIYDIKQGLIVVRNEINFCELNNNQSTCTLTMRSSESRKTYTPREVFKFVNRGTSHLDPYGRPPQDPLAQHGGE